MYFSYVPSDSESYRAWDGRLIDDLRVRRCGSKVKSDIDVYCMHYKAHLYRFSAFWLRSKCSICSYQLNIWYSPHCGLRILNWFLPDRLKAWACSASVAGCYSIALPLYCSLFKNNNHLSIPHFPNWSPILSKSLPFFMVLPNLLFLLCYALVKN